MTRWLDKLDGWLDYEHTDEELDALDRRVEILQNLFAVCVVVAIAVIAWREVSTWSS